MKKELKLIWAGMASLILVAAVCAIPPTTPKSPPTPSSTTPRPALPLSVICPLLASGLLLITDNRSLITDYFPSRI